MSLVTVICPNENCGMDIRTGAEQSDSGSRPLFECGYCGCLFEITAATNDALCDDAFFTTRMVKEPTRKQGRK